MADRGVYFGLLGGGLLFVAIGLNSVRQALTDDSFRADAVVLDATFGNLECTPVRDDDPTCKVDVSYEPAGGDTVRQRIAIDYELAYCAATPSFHLDGVKAQIYVHPQTHMDILLPRNPCKSSPFLTAAWFVVPGLLMAGLAIWMMEPWRRR